MKEDYLKLNVHGKKCLRSFLYAISANDILTSEIDYLLNKELIDYSMNYPDFKDRENASYYCLSNIGYHTAAHYFPKFRNWNVQLNPNNHE